VHASPQPGKLPYWQVNVPANQRTEQCPEYLSEQSEKNQRILATRDEDYRRQMWPEVQEIVSQCKISKPTCYFAYEMLIHILCRNQ
jgi:hypothetical protein